MESNNKVDDIQIKQKDAFEFLNEHYANLTQLSREDSLQQTSLNLEPLAGSILKTLAQDSHNVPLLVGESDMVIQHAVIQTARMMTQHPLPGGLSDSELFLIPTGYLLQRSMTDAEYPKFIEKTLRSAGALNAVLFIDNLCHFCEINFNEGHSAEPLFHTGLGCGAFYCIAGAPPEKANCLMQHAIFSSLDECFFTRLEAPTPSTEESLMLLRYIKPRLEIEPPEPAVFTDDSLAAALSLCQQHNCSGSATEKAIDLLRTAKSDQLVEKGLERKGKRGRPSKKMLMIDKEQVQQTATRLFLKKSTQSVTLDHACLNRLHASLSQRVMGQDEAIQAVTAALRLSAAGLKEPNKPKGVFLFAGSTGTGKTEMAKALAETLYGSTEHLIRIDMSEYTEYHNVSRLFGTPPGYVGFEGGGQLTNAIEKTPDCVVLLDEIEKAHPLVLNTFLQVFDDGRLTDGHGKTYSFRDSVIIMTTNLGAGALDQLQPKRIGFCDGSTSMFSQPGKDLYQHKVMEAIKGRMLPEFLNRVTKIIVFNPLDQETIHIILDKTIDKKMRLIADRKIQLELCAEARTLLEKEGFNPMNGAREMERSVDRLLMLPLADYLLEHEGLCEKTLHAEIEENGIVFMEERR